MSKTMTFPAWARAIPCKHETGDVDDSVTISNYHALTKANVEYLLKYVKVHKRLINTIQCRLVQGVPDIKCPIQIDGKVARAVTRVESAYMAFIDDAVYYKGIHEAASGTITGATEKILAAYKAAKG